MVMQLTRVTTRERRVVRSLAPQASVAVGDPLRALFDREYRTMVGLATALLADRAAAEDVVQQSFLAVEPVLPRLEPGGEGAYLRKVVMNGCRSQLRRDRARKRQPVLVRDDDVERPDDRAVHDEQHDRVLAAIDQLSLRQRQCIVLRYYGGLSDPEVAAALDLSLGSAKTHLRRGLDALHDLLGDLR
jgi:RNA polymerase sigma factor (sigma-70 family)